MICTQCGYKEIPEGASFCPKCGAEMLQAPAPTIAIHQEAGTVEGGKMIGLQVEEHHGALTVEITPPGAKAEPPPIPFQAPPPPANFVSHEAELAELRQRLLGGQAVGIVGLHGMGGIGKTALAAKLAHDLRGEFPDGVVWCDVGERDPLTILAEIARAYGVEVRPQSELQERAALVRSVLADKRALLVLDDMRQANVRHLPHLLPPPPCACVVTSRLEGLAGILTAKNAKNAKERMLRRRRQCTWGVHLRR